MARRLGLLLLLGGILVAGRFLVFGPAEIELALGLGARAKETSELELVVSDASGHVVRDVKLMSPAEHERRTLKLRAGSYTLGVRLVAAGATHTFSRVLRVESSGTYPIDLSTD